MANNTISQVEINGTTYDLLDANTLSALDSLKTRVTTLEDSVSLSTVSVSASHMLDTSITIHRRSGVAFTEMANLRNIAGNSETSLFTLPAGYRPPMLARWNVTSASGERVRIIADPNGAVSVYSFSSTTITNLSVAFTMVWLVA